MTELKRIEVVMEGGPVGPELQVVNMDDGPFYYADEADKRIAALEDQLKTCRNDTLERAAEIAEENKTLCNIDRDYVCFQGSSIAQSIRNEIDNDDEI